MAKPSAYDGLNGAQRAAMDAEIVTFYREGMTMDQAADAFKVSKSKVWSILKSYGVLSRVRVYIDQEAQ